MCHWEGLLEQVVFSVRLQHLLHAYLAEKFLARLNDSRRYEVGVLSLLLPLPQIKALSQLSCQIPAQQRSNVVSQVIIANDSMQLEEGVSPFCVHCAYLLPASFPTVTGLAMALSDWRNEAGATSVCLTVRALLQGRVRWATGIT